MFNDRSMVVGGITSQPIGLTVAILFAAGFGLLIKTAQFVPPALNVSTVAQVSSRTSPSFLSVVVGLCAGAAGAFGISTDLPVSLVGVAVAAALIPAAAAVGIGLAWGYPAVAGGAFVLLVAINLAGSLTLWYLGDRPDGWE